MPSQIHGKFKFCPRFLQIPWGLVASPSDFLYLPKTESHQHFNFHSYASMHGPEQDRGLLVQFPWNKAVLKNTLNGSCRDNTGNFHCICDVLFLTSGSRGKGICPVTLYTFPRTRTLTQRPSKSVIQLSRRFFPWENCTPHATSAPCPLY